MGFISGQRSQISTLSELIAEESNLSEREVEHLHRLVASWQLIADLSFADLLLWCPIATQGGGFVCVAQMRPYTAQTLHPEDVFGHTLRAEELPVIDRAFLEGRNWTRDEPILIDGVPVRMEAFPVRAADRVIAVFTKEGAPLTHRRPGRLEQNYLECGTALGRMVEQGSFPFIGDATDAELSPRVGDGLMRLDRSGIVTYASPNAISAYRRLGLVSNLEGERLVDVGIDSAASSLALSLGMPAEADVEFGNSVVLQRAVPFLEGKQREVVGALLLIRDVTELRHRERQLQRKEAVIREIHHRVKNNLQTIASLLRLQARRSGSIETKRELEEAVRRIASIAVVHETLSRESGELVDFKDIAEQIVKMVEGSLVLPGARITIAHEGEPGKLPAELATPLAVVLVELLQNAVEHAFPRPGANGRSGHIVVTMKRTAGRLSLNVKDDGVGLPAGFNIDSSSGLGLQIVKSLVEGELEGTIAIRSHEGTLAAIDMTARRRAGIRP